MPEKAILKRFQALKILLTTSAKAMVKSASVPSNS